MDYAKKAEELVTISADGDDVFVCDYTVDSVEKTEVIASSLRAALAEAMRAVAEEVRLETMRKCAMELRSFFGVSSASATVLAKEWDNGSGAPERADEDLMSLAFDRKDGDPAPRTNHGSQVYMWASDYAGAMGKYAFAKASGSAARETIAKNMVESARTTLVNAILWRNTGSWSTGRPTRSSMGIANWPKKWRTRRRSETWRRGKPRSCAATTGCATRATR